MVQTIFNIRTWQKDNIPLKASIKHLLVAAIFTLCVVGLAANAHATTYYVATNGNDNNPGTKTQPFLTIGLAVNSATSGDIVIVADGTYSGVGNHNIDFGGFDIVVQSASSNPANCIIDCQKSGCAFILKSGETAKSQIAGFTIKNGTGFGGNGGGVYMTSNNPVVNNCIFTGNSASNGNGGGMYNGTATNCTFNNNTTNGNGGGIYVGTATNCTFNNNSAPNGNGGGMFCYGNTATNCTFNNNSANGQAGGIWGGIAINCTFNNNLTKSSNGGAMYGNIATNCTFNNNSAPKGHGGAMFGGTVTNCIFNGNSTSGQGGGIFGGAAANCTFISNLAAVGGGMYGNTATNCTFINNSTTNGHGGGIYGGTANNCTFIGNSTKNGNGGGIWSVTAANCTFIGNSATNGGGMYGSTATNCTFTGNSATNGGGTYATSLYFCTLANNTATGNGGGIYLSNGTVTNCVVWGNTAGASGPNIYDDGTSTTRAVSYSDVQGGHPANGNIAADPLFVNSTSGNLHLTANSPCVDKGTTTVPSSLAFPTTDCDGGNRTVGAKPDMGAYEYGGSAILGIITFDSIAANAPAQLVSFQFRPVGGGTTLSLIYDTTADGAFYFNGIPDGSYNLWIKSPTYLATGVPVTISGGAANGITATLLGGDANNDNTVALGDFGILVNAYGGARNDGSGLYASRADLNGDGKVDLSDFGILVNNFGFSGDP